MCSTNPLHRTPHTPSSSMLASCLSFCRLFSHMHQVPLEGVPGATAAAPPLLLHCSAGIHRARGILKSQASQTSAAPVTAGAGGCRHGESQSPPWGLQRAVQRNAVTGAQPPGCGLSVQGAAV